VDEVDVGEHLPLAKHLLGVMVAGDRDDGAAEVGQRLAELENAGERGLLVVERGGGDVNAVEVPGEEGQVEGLLRLLVVPLFEAHELVEGHVDVGEQQQSQHFPHINTASLKC
jgi:hypothetical protein